ncbi:MAG: AAA family ATPase [Piscinibacter sp.]|nr:AAA family ATPase [Piscinibacter sp.]
MSAPTPLLTRFGDFQLDEGNARLTRGGAPVELQPKAFEVLCALLRTPGQLVLKDTLLDGVWGHRHVSESVLKSVINQLRNALGDDARQPRFIETAARRGYRFIAALQGPAGPAAALESVPAAVVDAPAAAEAERLIARARALALLHESLGLAARGQRQLVLVAGEAGIGKSTLIDRFVSALAGTAWRRAVGQCVEHYGSAEPYMPLLEALNLWCRDADGAALVELMRRVAPTWLVQLPWFVGEEDRRTLQREVAGATQDRMLREFGELLDRAATGQPLLLVLEDLHWSDHATVQLLGYLARRRSPAALLVLASFRPADVIATDHPLAGLRQELRVHRLCREVDLESFSEAEVGELVARRLGAVLPEDFVRGLHAHTDGLPLYVANVLDDLLDAGSLRQGDDGRWVCPGAADLGVPHHMVGVVERQIARLPAEPQRLLGAAAVAGAEFLDLPLADALALPAETLRAVLDTPAVRQHWLRAGNAVALPDGRIAMRLAFRHALYRHVFYERVGPAQRMQWHRALAAALRGAHGAGAREIAAELALHHERGGDVPAALQQLAVVAGRALERGASRESLLATHHALALLGTLPDGAARAAVELELRVLEGLALTRLHVFAAPVVAQAFERAVELCEHAGEPVGRAATRARALHGLWWVMYARCELVAARGLAERLLALAGGGGEGLPLRLAGHSAMGITLTMEGALPAAQQHLQAALALSTELGDELPPGLFVQHPEIEARAYLGVLSWVSGAPAQARAHIAAALARSAEIRHPISRLIALHMSAVVHFFAGEIEVALAATDELQGVIVTHGLPARAGAFSWLHAHLMVCVGQVEEGFAALHEAERSCAELGMRIGLTAFHLHFAESCRDTGRLDQAMAAVDRGLALAVAGPERFLLAELHRLKGALLRARGDEAGADAHLRDALAVAREHGAGFLELAALVDACRNPAAADAPALQERLRERLEPYRGETVALAVEGRLLLGGAG